MPDSIETRVGVLGEQIKQGERRADSLETQLRALGGIVPKVEVMDDRMQAMQKSSSDYRAEVQHTLQDIRHRQQSDYDHFTKEFEDRDAELAQAEKERLRGRRSLWLALATLMIAFGGLIITLLQLTSS